MCVSKRPQPLPHFRGHFRRDHRLVLHFVGDGELPGQPKPSIDRSEALPVASPGPRLSQAISLAGHWSLVPRSVGFNPPIGPTKYLYAHLQCRLPTETSLKWWEKRTLGYYHE